MARQETKPASGVTELPGEIVRKLLAAIWLNPVAEEIEKGVHDGAVERDPEFIENLLPWMEVLNSYFDSEVRGFENLPAKGPMLLVGNHSGGMLTPDTTAFFCAWYRERGLEEPLVGLALDGAYAIPAVGAFFRRIGEVPANLANAARALDSGAAVLVYPGGDHEVFRPWTQRNRIDFGARKGFVKLALDAGVPVLPLVGHGGHNSTIVLARGDGFARFIGLERLRVNMYPLSFQIPWGVSFGWLPGIPLPSKITLQVCPAMDWSGYGPDDADDPEVVDRCYDEITQVMQETLTALAKERPFPVLNRLRGFVSRRLGI